MVHETRTDLAVLVFAKLPEPGRCKTRLATRFGDEVAAQLAAAFLADTLDRLRAWGGARVILLGDRPDREAFASYLVPEPASTAAPPGLEYWHQGGGDLGDRQERAFRRVFSEGVTGAIALGADTPDLPLDDLEVSSEGLDVGQVVIGPSTDGGYTLLALPRSLSTGGSIGLPRLFSDHRWGESTVLSSVVDRLKEADAPLVTLPPRVDFDTVSDLQEWWSRRGERSPRGPEPRRTLDLVRSLLGEAG